MGRAHSWRVVAALSLLTLGSVAPAAAQTRTSLARAQSPVRAGAVRRVVVLNPPAPLAKALRTALSPWGVRMTSVDRERPGATLPGTAMQAGALARELGAETLVWISSNAEGAALWMYEAESDTVRARPFASGPLGATLAAALALSVKTWLLSTEPDPAEIEALPLPELPLPEPPLPAAAPSEPPAPSAVVDGGTEGSRPAAHLRVLLHAAARGGVVGSEQADARYGAELRLSPWSDESQATQLWVGARFDTGTASDVERPELRSTYSDSSGAVSVGLSRRLWPSVSAGVHAGPALHRSVLYDTVFSDGRTAQRESTCFFSAQLRPEVDVALGPVGVVLQGTLGVPLRKQDYIVGEVTPIETNAVWWMIGGALRLDVL